MQALSRFSIKVYFLPGVYLVVIGFTEFKNISIKYFSWGISLHFVCFFCRVKIP